MAISFTTNILPLYATNVIAGGGQAAYQSPGTFGIPASYVATGSIASIAVNNPGSGYTTVVPTVVIGGDGASGAATARMKLLSLAVLAGGSGYAVGNTITLAVTGGTAVTAVVVTVTAVNTGAVTAVSITTPGVYTAIAAAATQSATSGGGTGATFNTLTWGVDSITVGTPGNNYTTAPISFTGGTGSGVIATAQIDPAGATAAGGSVNEQGILTMIEIMRAYFAEIQTAQEARFVNTVLRKMLAELQQGGGSTYSAANNASRAQTEAMRFFAKRIRNPNL